jgi:hypothetical protein
MLLFEFKTVSKNVLELMLIWWNKQTTHGFKADNDDAHTKMMKWPTHTTMSWVDCGSC